MKTILVSFLLLFTFPLITFAEEEVVTEDVSSEQVVSTEENITTATSKYFDLVLTRSAQLPFGKKVTYEIEITPHMDSNKTQIIWDLPSTIEVSPKHTEFVELKKEETGTYKATITPTREGTYVINVNVISWQYDTNYTNSIKDTVTFDQSLILQPVSTAYQVGNALKIFLILILSAGTIYIGYVLSKKGSKSLKKWLTPEV